MAIYYIIFAVLALFSIMNHVREFRQYRLPFFLFSAILLILLSGLRASTVTPDYGAYVANFLFVPDLSYWLTGEFVYTFAETWMEPAYVAFGAFIKLFTSDYRWMFLGVASLSVGIAAYNYYKLSKYAFLTLLLFFVHTYLYRDMTQIRSAIAAAIGLFLIPQLSEQKRIKPLITISFAGLFHMASLSLLIAYFISLFNFNRKHILLGLGISFLLAAVGVSNLLIQALPNLGYITVILEGYQNSQYVDTVNIFDLTNVKNLSIMCLILFFWKRLKKKVPFFEMLALFMFLATAWRIVFSDFGIFAARISTFFGIVEVILLPSFVMIFRSKLIITLLIIAYSFATLYLNTIKMVVNPYDLAF